LDKVEPIQITTTCQRSFMKFTDSISSITVEDNDYMHDSLVDNALLANLLPEGSISRDGTRMFHGVVQSVTVG